MPPRMVSFFAERLRKLRFDQAALRVPIDEIRRRQSHAEAKGSKGLQGRSEFHARLGSILVGFRRVLPEKQALRLYYVGCHPLTTGGCEASEIKAIGGDAARSYPFRLRLCVETETYRIRPRRALSRPGGRCRDRPGVEFGCRIIRAIWAGRVPEGGDVLGSVVMRPYRPPAFSGPASGSP